MILFIFNLFIFLTDPPPGTIKVKGYFVDKTEILNIHWMEFLYYKRLELDSIKIKKVLPDSSNFWYSSAKNRFQPIVLITYEQAVEYCSWRSKIVSERLGKKIIYRLPTPSEWTEIAQEVLHTNLKRNTKELRQLRKVIQRDSTRYLLINRVKSTSSRVFDLFDNVTEMTNEKGVAMGANNSKLPDIEINLTRLIKYNSVNSYLGFRCIAEFK